MDGIVTTLLPSVILLGLVFVPTTAVIAAIFYLRRQEAREARRSPLPDKLPHQAGAQARKRAEDLGDSIMESLMQVMLIGPIAMLVILLPRVNWSRLQFGWLNWVVIVGAVLWVAWLTRRVVLLRRQRKQWHQGMLAEIAVAQQLDRLMAQQCFLLHDIPGNGWNIDHVVVGPHAVFTVETKSRRKPGAGKASANVTYDGKTLRFPDWTETKPLDQARAQARWLAEYLKGETGDMTPVIPVVALPGWYVTLGKDANRSEVRVINPKMCNMFVESGARPKLEPAHRNRIVNALWKRYPELDVAG